MGTFLALGASTALAMVVLGGGGRGRAPYREKWESSTSSEARQDHLESLRDIPPEGVTVPFKLIKDNPILPIMLDGDDHLTCWIVDSGYGYTAVSSALAKRLGLRSTGTMAVQTLKTDSLTMVTLPAGAVFDLQRNMPVVQVPPHSGVVRNLPGTLDNTYGRGRSCLKQGGILGITFLRHFATRLDYGSRTMTFFDPARFHYPMAHSRAPSRGGQRFTGFLVSEHYFLVPMVIDGVKANMALDTGAFATIMTKGFLRKYANQKGVTLDQAGGMSGQVEASFSEHPITLTKKRLNRVLIGHDDISGDVLHHVEILFPDCHDSAPCPGLLDTDRFDGLLGYSILKHFTIYMVYEPTPYVVLEPL